MKLTRRLFVLCTLAVLTAGCCSTRSDFDPDDCYGYAPCDSSASLAAQVE